MLRYKLKSLFHFFVVLLLIPEPYLTWEAGLRIGMTLTIFNEVRDELGSKRWDHHVSKVSDSF